MNTSSSARFALALCAGLATLSAPARAQQRTDTVTPGPEYRASPRHGALLGREYRDLWTTPISIPVLDLSRFAGGLKPTKLGGGNQTRSLRFKGANGREYAFRSVNKDVTGALPRDLQNTVVDRVIQDQTSSQLPLGIVVAQRLEAAAGVLHALAQPYVMPDDPRLGEFRAEFAGMLGTLEERPDDDKDAPRFAGAERIADTEDTFERIGDHPRERIDTHDFLTGRLVDLLIGDWDRHGDQYKWARYPTRGGGALWRPIPRDRDYAFVEYDGRLVALARQANPKLVTFAATYPEHLTGYILNAQFLDRRILGELHPADWDSVTEVLRARLNDAVIDSAIGLLPTPYQAQRGATLRAALRLRRDSLPRISRRFYSLLAGEPELYATDKADRADITREPDGTLDVAIYVGDDLYLRRRFDPRETREVRLFMQGGDDRVTVRGAGSGIIVRAVGGKGDDLLEDTGTGPTRFYDSEGENQVRRGTHTSFSDRPHDTAVWDRGNLRAPPRDWGTSGGHLGPTAAWRTGVGPLVGVGITSTRYGFRRAPYTVRGSASAMVSPLYGRFGAFASADIRAESSADHLTLDGEVSNLDIRHFYGYGNDTPTPDDVDRTWHRTARFEPVFHHALNPRTVLGMGARLRYLDAKTSGTALDSLSPVGRDPFFTAAALAELAVAPRDSTIFPRRGFAGSVGGAVNPASTAGIGAYGEAHAVVKSYLSAGGRRAPVLALRGGAMQTWGDVPFQDAATVGGYSTLRGYRTDRFTGDAAAWGTAELRAPITRAKLIVKGNLGVLGLADAGRVFVDGDSPGGWHTAYGAGVWFSFLDESRMVSATWAHGERNALYLSLGTLF